jgi:CHAD domain-containing protein
MSGAPAGPAVALRPPPPPAEATDAAADAEAPAPPQRRRAAPVDEQRPIRLELALDPEWVPRLRRHAAFARSSGDGTARGGGRSRSAATARIWYDTAEGTLAARGLVLEAPRRGPRRLLRALPAAADAAWHPAAPPEVVESVGDGAAPEEAGDLPLVPIAAFDGRSVRLPVSGPQAAADAPPLACELLHGRLRAVAAERAAARLAIAGPAAPALALARALAADLPVLPPLAALAEEGRALARGEATPRPRRRGAPDLAGVRGVEDAFAAAVAHLLEAMLFQAPLARIEAGPEGVHQMRVALRRLRSVLKLFRPACDGPSLRALDGRLKALADALGPARDWDVFLGGMAHDIAAALPPGEKRFAALLRAAEARRAAAYAALRATLDGAGFRALVWDAVSLLALRGWRAEAAPDDAEAAAAREGALDAFAEAALARRWRRLLARGEALAAAAPDDAEALHALRLEGKRMRYAAEVFAPLWPGKPSRRFVKRLAALQEALGLANDAAVARGLVAGLAAAGRGGPAPAGRTTQAHHAWAGGVVEGWALARARRVRGKAMARWDALMRLDPFWVAD